MFYLRLRVPGGLVEKVGRTHWVRSLGTGYRGEAVRLARIAAADFERMLMRAEGRCDPADHRRIIPAKRSEPAQPLRPERTFRDLFDLFMADPSRTRVRKTDMVYATLFDMASGLWGADRPLRAIDREACRDLLDLLRWLPSNPTKRFPKLTAVQAARMAKATIAGWRRSGRGGFGRHGGLIHVPILFSSRAGSQYGDAVRRAK